MRTTRTSCTANHRRRILLLGAVAIAAAGLGACASLFGPRTVDITREELQARLARKFPLTKRVLNMFDVTATLPRLEMVADTNRVLAAADLKARDTVFGRDYIGTVNVSFGLRYEPKDLTLRILDLNVDRIHIEGMPEGFQQMLQDLGNKVAREHLQDFPIHQFKPEDLRAADRMGYQVEDIKVTKTGLAVHLVPRP
ncbi:MAG: hypothetical protein QM742_17720 [Aquabacterium sp.]